MTVTQAKNQHAAAVKRARRHARARQIEKDAQEWRDTAPLEQQDWYMEIQGKSEPVFRQLRVAPLRQDAKIHRPANSSWWKRVLVDGLEVSGAFINALAPAAPAPNIGSSAPFVDTSVGISELAERFSANRALQASTPTNPPGYARNRKIRSAGDHHHHHHHSRNATVYPQDRLSSWMRNLINSVESVGAVIAPALRKIGLEPDTPMVVTTVSNGQLDIPGGSQQQTVTATVIVQHFCTTAKIGLTVTPDTEQAATLINAIRNAEDKGENFFEKEGLKPVQHKFKHEGLNVIGDKLLEFGVFLEDKGTVHYVQGRKSFNPNIGSLRGHYTKGDLGTIIRVTENAIRHFAIVPHHPDLVIAAPDPGDAVEWDRWMNEKGKYLFFRNPEILSSQPDFTTYQEEGDEVNPKGTVRGGVRHTINPMVDRTVKHMADLVSNDTPIMTTIHTILGLYIPYYDFARTLLRGEYKKAIVFLGFELIPYVGHGAKTLVKTQFKGTFIHGAANHLDKWAPAAFNAVKDTHGMGVIEAVVETDEQTSNR